MNAYRQQPVEAELMSPQSPGQAFHTPVEPLVFISILLVEFNESFHLATFFRTAFQRAQIFEISALKRKVLQQQLE